MDNQHVAKKLRILLNGKKAGQEDVRQAIDKAREHGLVDVRVTWEGGDIARLVKEAVSEQVERLVVAGGDGSVNEMVNALMAIDKASRPAWGIMPLGTANDFATACEIPADLFEALRLAQAGDAYPVDCIRANEHYFMNVASGGFGAQVTVNTPPALKNFLGGGAYTLSGVVQALKFSPFAGTVTFPDGTTQSDSVIVAAVCNGSQAGGGQILAADAKINDGLMRLMALSEFPLDQLNTVVEELQKGEDGKYVHKHHLSSVTWQTDKGMPINLDGEPLHYGNNIVFEVKHLAVNLVLPPQCPLLVKAAGPIDGSI
ncbi:lipid kinase YegS [Parasalinivibrio latis]|uniref:lipid kinase YegS n=1 Tax=Parasalinivibrio latis TaxID=2952610 RepID=UPI0030E4E4B1